MYSEEKYHMLSLKLSLILFETAKKIKRTLGHTAMP